MNKLNLLNKISYNLDILKHKPPKLTNLNTDLNEQKSVIFKEIKLPKAEQTHEICYEPKSNYVFVSQMSNSVLVRIPVCHLSGLLLDQQDAWLIGETDSLGKGISGLHNISLSYKYPGCLWVSLQYANTIFLLEATTMNILKIFRVPIYYKKSDNEVLKIGGPHAIRECPHSGLIWVALKGAISCHPNLNMTNDYSSENMGFKIKQALNRNCCSIDRLQEYMSILESNGYDSPLPNAFAIWKLNPDNYNYNLDNRGGYIYECLGSPPMITIDKLGNCWIAQDQNPSIMKIDSKTNNFYQIPIILPQSNKLKITGPTISTSPSGDIWASLIGGNCSFLQIKSNNNLSIHEFECPEWTKSIRIINFDFIIMNNKNLMYALSSDLLDEKAINAIVIIEFNQEWEKIINRRIVPLPTQDCSSHRITSLTSFNNEDNYSIIVTEMASSKLLQVKIKNLDTTNELKTTVSFKNNQYYYFYQELDDISGMYC